MSIGKVVLVSDQPITTGIGRYAWALAKALSKKQIDVSLIYNGYFDPGYKGEYFDVIESSIFKKTTNYLAIPLARKMNSVALKFYAKEYEDSIVHFCGSDYSGLKLFNNTVATIHDVRFDLLFDFKSGGFIRNLLDSIYRDFINLKMLRDVRSAAKIISISNVVKSQLERHRIRSQVIHHWIDSSVFKKRDKALSRRKLGGLPENSKLILNVSNGTKNKALSFLQETVNLLPEGYMLIKIGTPLKGRNILNVGKVPDELYPLYFNASDLYLNVSTFEGFGIPQIEALGSGLPVLARDISINREVLAEAGMYFDAYIEPPHDLAQVVVHSIEEYERDGLGDKMEKVARRLNEDTAISEYLKVYSSIGH